ncbi:MAG: aspartate--tRNA ligase, partial [Gammaproteobacteria bacterium]|nr:aspartate--tRNA ligase [Gammaproteobacteria bacterium]
MRTHLCTSLGESHIETDVVITGWTNSRRDHGGLIFIDLRDHSGIVQVVVSPEQAESFARAESVRNEYVLRVSGKVSQRPEGTENSALPTGEVEVVADELVILNKTDQLPFQIDDDDVNETVRLKYRYLDLRRSRMQGNLRLRHALVRTIRTFLEKRDFIEIETPMLTRSTPEGARDYLVPSRIHTGSFYAMPQSPQMFKQILVISGFERYYQIVRCFRDEDLRADRQPEFTQLDIEMAFVEESDIMQLMEDLYLLVFRKISSVELPSQFPVLTYADAMRRYGYDLPDLRIPLELTDLTEAMKREEFKVF